MTQTQQPSTTSTLTRETTALGLLVLLFAAAFFASLTMGQYPVSLHDAFNALFHFDENVVEQIIVITSRLPRTIMACFVGAALGISGVLMQAVTRNPLASPSILGINSGAIFLIVLASTLAPHLSIHGLIWVGMAGAALAGGIVYLLGSLGSGGLTPTRLVLGGAALTALFVSFTQAVLVVNQDGLDRILFWLAGSLAGRDLDSFLPVMPYIAAGIIASLFIGRHVNILMSGDDIAKGLGQNTAILKITIAGLVILLAGSSVSAVGNIAFLGLIVPHIVRLSVTGDHRWLIPLSGLAGAVLLLVSDIIARQIIMPEELPIGAMTAILGAPLFVLLARRNFAYG
ncbi:FecCD family ABC transporter permease [Thalassospira marina]|uniref:Iron-siderophore ABC transporter permease n=1 Tax=Thalassospira marina TaxID=2048283 RepID=A0ABM6QGX8_9PROT|nr:iron ABC transporter permease [Thalassospira marina]AUG55862.1 iron-siderophore ABC transporter permease [Thalassospira marina]